MATTECIPYYEPGERFTGHATAAVTGKRFLGVSGNIQSGPGLNTGTAGGNISVAHAAAAAAIIGVSGYDAALGDKVPVLGSPGMVLPVTAEVAIAAGAEVQVGAAGQAVPFGNGAVNGIKVGICLTAATAGSDAMIKLY